MNEDFQIARRDQKAFFSDQCKEREENNRMGKTRYLFKKIRDTKGTFHAKMGTIKDRNGTDLTEAKVIKKRWQEYTEPPYKKDLHDPDNHDGVITHTHLEPDILECEVKWSLGSITTNKASGSDGIPVELFQILKDDAVKVLHSICQQIWNTQQWPQDWKRSVFILIPKKGYVFPFRPQLLAETEHSEGPHGSFLLDSRRFGGRGSPLQHGAPLFHVTAFFMGILPCPWPCVLWPVPSLSGCLA